MDSQQPANTSSIDSFDMQSASVRWQNREFRHFVFFVFVCGLMIRGYFCLNFTGLHWADEHQQYLEQAFRIVHGYGVTFWEQDVGHRHPFYQTWLALQLYSLESIGITDPFVLNGAIHFIQAALILFSVTIFFASRYRPQTPAFSYISIFLYSFWPNCIYVDCRILTESVLIIPILWAYILLPKRPFWSGLLLGLTFSIRFQAILFTATIGLIWLIQLYPLKRATLKTLCRGLFGCLVGLMLVGFMDWIAYQHWFHSLFTSLHNTFVEKVGERLSTEPWYQYFAWLILPSRLLAVITFGLAISVVRSTWRWWFIIAIYLSFHMMMSHKESRFIWTLLPFWIGIISYALHRFHSYLKFITPVVQRLLAFGLFAWFAIVELRAISWEQSPFTPSAKLLHQANQIPEIKGIAVVGYHNSVTGNYWYLRKNIPLLIDLKQDITWWVNELSNQNGEINAVICSVEMLENFPPGILTPIRQEGSLVLSALDLPSFP